MLFLERMISGFSFMVMGIHLRILGRDYCSEVCFRNITLAAVRKDKLEGLTSLEAESHHRDDLNKESTWQK